MKRKKSSDHNFQMNFWSGFRDSINASYLRGFFDAEGSIRKARPHVSLSNTDVKLMDKVVDFLSANDFKFQAKMRSTPSRKLPYCEIDIMGFAQVYKWFSTIGNCLDRKLATWETLNKSYPYRNPLPFNLQIPVWDIDIDYIRGFFDGEGTLVYIRRTHSIVLRIAITDYDLLRNIHRFLLSLGLPFAFREFGSATNKGYKQQWEVSISNFGLIEKWFGLIGTSSYKHFNKWHQFQELHRIRKLVDSLGRKIPFRKKPRIANISQEEKMRLLLLYQCGLTSRQIADKLNRSVTCIYNIKHEFRIPVPEAGRANLKLHEGQMLG